jgi:hypothetical protein
LLDLVARGKGISISFPFCFYRPVPYLFITHMKPVLLSEADMASLSEVCNPRNLILAKVSASTISITRDSMVALFPDADEEYYRETVKLLHELIPSLYWMCDGKTDDVGFFTCYNAAEIAAMRRR